MGEALSESASIFMSKLNTFLAGVKVLDLSQYIPGPMAGLYLADLGAEVLKIEPPQGDPMRQLGPRDAQGEPVFHRALNGGKSIRRMDLKNPAERDALLAMLPEYDVLIEGFRPGVMKRLGLDYATVSKINPRIVYCAISGYGATGSLAQRPAHDANYLATSGIMHRNGTDAPVFYDPPVSDVTGSLFAATAILGALYRRQKDGQGCHLDLGLADVAMPIQMLQIAAWGADGTNPARRETYLNGGAAFYNIYATRDGGHVMLGAVEPKFWTNFCMLAERPEWITRQSEPMPQAALSADLANYFSSKDLAAIVARFGDAECCLSPVHDLAQALSQPHLEERGLVRRSGDGELQALFPVLVDGAHPQLRAQPGEHREGAASIRAPKKISVSRQ